MSQKRSTLVDPPRDQPQHTALQKCLTKWDTSITLKATEEALDASDMERTMEAALQRFFDTQDIEAVPIQRQDRKGYTAWKPGWS